MIGELGSPPHCVLLQHLSRRQLWTEFSIATTICVRVRSLRWKMASRSPSGQVKSYRPEPSTRSERQRVAGRRVLTYNHASHMNNSLKWLVLASLTNLVGNSLGTVIALQHNLTANFGGFLHGQDVLRDFLTMNGTALSAPLAFLLIQLGLTVLALLPGKSSRIGVGGLIFVGAFYTIAQLGEPMVLRLWHPDEFDLAQAIVLLVNVASAIAMQVLGIRVWRTMRAARPIPR
jgi:hypothetical protein